ncbi:hypothetical protein J6590_104370 [Homalodisca vitripennis]|nr:hypothetical protein J6590_104370 [Homalodisca vitripennis]
MPLSGGHDLRCWEQMTTDSMRHVDSDAVTDIIGGIRGVIVWRTEKRAETCESFGAVSKWVRTEHERRWRLQPGMRMSRMVLQYSLPPKYDLHPDLPVHDETVLVNAYIEELAARYNARVLNLGGIGRKFFTRHGQHLTMRGKRLLARMIVRVASERPLKTAGAPGLAIPTVSSSPTISQVPAAVNPQHQHSGRLQHISYAEALRKYPVLDSGDKSGSAAAVPRGVNGAQAASMSPGGGVLAGATESSKYISPTIRQTDSQSTF